MPKAPESLVKDTRAAACLGFVLAAVAGSLASVALIYWKQMAELFKGMPSRVISGGTAFSVNLPGMAMELPAYVVGIFAFIALGSTWFWKPATLRSWYSLAGLLCLVPVMALFAARLGWIR